VVRAHHATEADDVGELHAPDNASPCRDRPKGTSAGPCCDLITGVSILVSLRCACYGVSFATFAPLGLVASRSVAQSVFRHPFG
jgi:hypothetical protein